MKLKLLLILTLCCSSFIALAQYPPVITKTNISTSSADFDISGIQNVNDYFIEVLTYDSNVWGGAFGHTSCNIWVDFTECGQAKAFRLTAWNQHGTTTLDFWLYSPNCE